MASQVCRGYNNEHLKAIQQETMGEWIYFHEWFDDLAKQIVECLYPLKGSDVDSVDFDYASKTASIKLKNIKQSPPLWQNPYNLTLSEKVTGWKIKIIQS